MIVEHALLRVKSGQGSAFEVAMKKAKSLIALSPGFRWIEVCPASEVKDYYLLLVGWNDIDSHRDGFRKSDQYQDWRNLLHGFYEPMPCVTYFGASVFDD